MALLTVRFMSVFLLSIVTDTIPLCC